jgi:hypothetical protein
MATTVVRAQSPNPPVPIELMFGHEKLDFQAILKRNFTPTSKFSFLAISVFSENYDQEEELGNSIVLPFQVNYALGKKGFAVALGGEANSIAGFSTTVGLEHAFANRKILAITLLNYFLNEEHDIKLFGLYEYRPALNETWSFYSRLQFMYNHSSSENLHNRSFLYTRAGLKKGPLSFGLGANWDRYGPQRTTKTNFGLFTKWDF